ncbi:hypothetical protein A3Q56_02185 [Intoshia linei]|uniref:Sorting nexin-3 n=1 Tax=Intoshia linei TaxID=1819745 RepID=A0A177B6Y3_9BILA|nr:hypothetical protein A3Q56_02185 [Intoshia linei]
MVNVKRLCRNGQTLEEAYTCPSNFLEIDVSSPDIKGTGPNKHVVYRVTLNTNIPVFATKQSTVYRRYSDFEWLKNELEREDKVHMQIPEFPSKSYFRNLPFRSDNGLFDPKFIERRRKGLEDFINKIVGHPVAREDIAVHMFLLDEQIDRNYIPGRVTPHNN